jgi:hypothetical protein
VDHKYAAWRNAPAGVPRRRAQTVFKRLDQKLRLAFPKFCYKHKVIE